MAHSYRSHIDCSAYNFSVGRLERLPYARRVRHRLNLVDSKILQARNSHLFWHAGLVHYIRYNHHNTISEDSEDRQGRAHRRYSCSLLLGSQYVDHRK